MALVKKCYKILKIRLNFLIVKKFKKIFPAAREVENGATPDTLIGLLSYLNRLFIN